MNELLTMLDTKYKRLEYLESTGVQYIDTGILANDESGMQVDVQWLNNSDTVCIGSRGNSTATRCFIGNAITGFYLAWNELGSSRPAHNLNRNVLSLNFYNNRKKIFNGTELSDTLQTLSTQTGNMYLFVANDNGSASLKSSVKMYSAQITQGSTLVRNFIPVLRKSDNEIGMLDLVEGKFYPNAGTGKFTANLDTMYAIIQGSPTVQDGRVSGFSDSNYLLVKNFNGIFPLSGKISFIYERTSTMNQALIHTQRSSVFPFRIRTIDRTPQFSWVDTDDNQYHLSLDYLLVEHTLYYITWSYEGGKLYFNLLNSLGETISTKNTETIINLNLGVNFLSIGRIGSTSYFQGTIDLNRSYIKIDDTKYKLQAVVGYTKVGSPTITDGVATNLSSNDYLWINKVLPIVNSQNWKISYKFKATQALLNTTGEAYTFRVVNTYFGIGIVVGKLSFVHRIPNEQVSRLTLSNITLNTTDWILVEIEVVNGVGTFRGTIGNNIESVNFNWSSSDELNNNNTIYLTRTIGSLYVAELDLNNTYIKINNKLWFNGLEA